MSIANRISDAEILWNTEHKEGAFLCALIAVAATARKRFKNEKDSAAFVRFLEQSTNVKMSVEFRGKLQALEFVFYKFMRCHLVHEGELPPDIRFTEEMVPSQMSVRAGGAPEYILKIGTGWFFHLLQVVRTAPENSDQFT